MTSNGNYPAGAQYDPNAPWNQSDIEEKEIEVTISITLSKTTKVIVPTYNGHIDAIENDDLKSYVKDQIYLPHELPLLAILPEVTIPEKMVKDFSDWNIDDFEVIKE